MNDNITIDLTSNSLSSKIITLTISSSILIIVMWLIITKGMIIFNNDSQTIRNVFSYVVLSIIGITFPSVLNFSIIKTIIIKDTCTIDRKSNSISIMEINRAKKSLKIIKQINIEKLKEIIYIRINEDEDGIINNYHIYSVSSDGIFEKIYTFQKFHYALRFIKKLINKTEYSCLDWTDFNFEKEIDFVDHYNNRN